MRPQMQRSAPPAIARLNLLRRCGRVSLPNNTKNLGLRQDFCHPNQEIMWLQKEISKTVLTTIIPDIHRWAERDSP